MLFEQNELNKVSQETQNIQREQVEYSKKFGFLEQLQSAVRTDEEYAKFKGYLD